MSTREITLERGLRARSRRASRSAAESRPGRDARAVRPGRPRSEEGRKQKAKVRTSTANKWSRMTWTDGTSVEAGFYDKGENKSTIAVQHSKLPDAKSVSEQKQFWSAVIAKLKKEVES